MFKWFLDLHIRTLERHLPWALKHCTAKPHLQGLLNQKTFISVSQHNTDGVFRGYDHNVLPVWEQGVTGKNVVVSILDDGKCS